MALVKSSTCLILMLQLGVFKVVYSQVNCKADQTNFCEAHCQWTDGSIITLDISNLVPYPYTIQNASDPNSGYFQFTPCKGARCSENNNFDSAVCQVETNGKVYSLGSNSPNLTGWSLNSISPYMFSVFYAGGDCVGIGNCKQSEFIFQENSNSDTVTIEYTTTEVTTYMFKVTGKCIGQQTCNESANLFGPVGFALIAVSILAGLVYFTVGVLVMKFQKGAQGKELIPNYTFWVDLPFLIIDGCLFVISPLYKRGNKDKYDSL